MDRKRHGFVTFWLVAMIIFSCISIIINITVSKFAILHNFLNIGYIICYVLLLNWKIIGFYVSVGLALIEVIRNIALIITVYGTVTGTSLFGILGYSLSVLIDYLILQIRKDGISVWIYMTKKDIIISEQDDNTNAGGT